MSSSSVCGEACSASQRAARAGSYRQHGHEPVEDRVLLTSAVQLTLAPARMVSAAWRMAATMFW